MVMQISQETNTANYQINSYQAGQIEINHNLYKKSILITVNSIIEWNPSPIKELTHEDFSSVLSLKPDLILLGTGKQLIFPPPSLQYEFLTQKIGFEVMNTPAACRTYNILVAEDRHIIAALIVE